MLAQLGCRIVELGHAERRAPPYNEDPAFIAQKIEAVVRGGMIPLICVGEKERRELSPGDLPWQATAAAMYDVGPQVRGALEAAYRGFKDAAVGASVRKAHIIFAYEPIWAIGAKEPAEASYVCDVVHDIKEVVAEYLYEEDGEQDPETRQDAIGDVRYLYGGSARPGTWEGLKGECDGLFLGRFAHEAKNFVDVVQEVGTSFLDEPTQEKQLEAIEP